MCQIVVIPRAIYYRSVRIRVLSRMHLLDMNLSLVPCQRQTVKGIDSGVCLQVLCVYHTFIGHVPTRVGTCLLA